MGGVVVGSRNIDLSHFYRAQKDAPHTTDQQNCFQTRPGLECPGWWAAVSCGRGKPLRNFNHAFKYSSIRISSRHIEETPALHAHSTVSLSVGTCSCTKAIFSQSLLLNLGGAGGERLWGVHFEPQNPGPP